MKLSVIIVNYNVKAYLEQCLLTVQSAMEGIDGDVFVVDNLSTDGSVEMVREKFPEVELIANQKNAGFSRANNQAIELSTSEYVVLLNPDTVVGEDVFRKVVDFMDLHPEAGGLGVRMIDGRGRFLPESKRGLPTPAVAFYKIIGLTRLFPKSKVFGRYHLGHLPEDRIASIEILSGACMFLRKKVLDEVGTLDESFFMYGEDIDLSYRILKGGYQNFYFPDAKIIHYKGESTKKSSINYVFVFYNAMAIFAKKHFAKKRADVFASLINGSIFLSAAAAIVARFLYRLILPITDLLLGASVVLLFRSMGAFHKIELIPLMIILLVIWCIAGLNGVFDRPVKLMKCITGAALGGATVGLLMQFIPGTLPLTLVAALTFLTMAIMVLSRIILHLIRIPGYQLRNNYTRRVLAVGTQQAASKATALIWQTHYGLGDVRTMAPSGHASFCEQVAIAIRKHRADEVIFCAGDLPTQQIIELMNYLQRTRAQFKIAYADEELVIGPNSIESLQDLRVLDRYAVNSSAGRRSKRVADICISLGLLLALPITAWFIRHPTSFLKNWWEVMRGKRTWVGYTIPALQLPDLPKLVPSVIPPWKSDRSLLGDTGRSRAALAYAKDYHPITDITTVLRNMQGLDHRP